MGESVLPNSSSLIAADMPRRLVTLHFAPRYALDSNRPSSYPIAILLLLFEVVLPVFSAIALRSVLFTKC